MTTDDEGPPDAREAEYGALLAAFITELRATLDRANAAYDRLDDEIAASRAWRQKR